MVVPARCGPSTRTPYGLGGRDMDGTGGDEGEAKAGMGEGKGLEPDRSTERPESPLAGVLHRFDSTRLQPGSATIEA